MPLETTGSTVPRRQLGRYLRELRGRSGMTIKVASRRLERSEATMWRIETGQVSIRSIEVEAMCRAYGADSAMTEALMGLAKETKQKGWWHSYGDVIPDGFDIYIGLEEAASELDWYEAELVPGLLQTENYARTVITADTPDLDEEEIGRRVQVRIARQAPLRRPGEPPQLRAVLNEAILRRPFGGPAVMAEQLRHLASVGSLPSVSLRVMPFSAGLNHGALSGAFVILRFPRNGDGRDSEPPTVFAASLTGDLYLDKPVEIARHAAVFAAIWEAASDEAASQTLIQQAAKEMEP